MADLLQALIRDTLICLKDPLFPKQTLFATAEECSLFQQRPKDKRAAPAPPLPPAPPFREMAAPGFVVRPAPQPQSPPKETAPPPPKEPKPQAKTPPETGTATRLKPGVPVFFDQSGERGKPRSVRPTKAIAEGAIAEEEDRYGEAAAAPVAEKNWNTRLKPGVPVFFDQSGERGKPRSVRPTKAIAEGAIAEEEDRYGEAAAAPVAEKNWNTRLKATLQKIAPALQLTDVIPDDTEAKRIAGAFADKIPDADVILLACRTDADTTEFLKNLARAIDQHLGRTKILPADKLEQQQRWDLFLQMNSFKLIVASDGIEQLPNLRTFYRADPPRLDQIPLLALSSSVVYKSIEHKANLWKTLCQILGK